MSALLRDMWRWFKKEPWLLNPVVFWLWWAMTIKAERTAHINKVLGGP